jgi:carboxylate-amine ligase
VEHAFGSGPAFTAGVEEELLLVDEETLELAHVAELVLPRMDVPVERADHEAFSAELELRSPPSASAAEAVGSLSGTRAAARAAGATLMAAGLHPDARFGDVQLVRKERYERVEAEMRGLIKRTPECALHVHVALPDPDTAAAAFTGLRAALPLVQGLGANSPFWFGSDSGLASARAAMVRSYPGRGIPPALHRWDDYLEALEAIAAGGGPTDYTMVWWDMRLQPRLGTVELRELDVQTSLTETAGLVALVQGLTRRAAESSAERPAPDQALHWSSFRAVRDGLDAEILFNGRLMPLRHAAREALDSLGASDPALEGVERILREGNGADRQRAAHARGGMPGLLRYLVDETAKPYAG